MIFGANLSTRWFPSACDLFNWLGESPSGTTFGIHLRLLLTVAVMAHTWKTGVGGFGRNLDGARESIMIPISIL